VSFPIAKLDIAPTWKGLYARDQRIPDEDEPHQYAVDARNVEFYGSILRKRRGTALMNGIWDVLDMDWPAGQNWVPEIRAGSWRDYYPEQIHAGETLLVHILDPNDPHYGAMHFFNITGLSGFDVIVGNPPGYTIPTGSAVYLLFDTYQRRIGGLFQPSFRNGAYPLLASSVHQNTAEFQLHIQANRRSPALDLFQRMPQTTIATWSVNNGTFLSQDGLAVGDWVYFPTQNQNGRVDSILSGQVHIDVATKITPTPVPGQPVYFFPNSCPGRVSPTRPIGLGKMSAAHIGNRTIIAMPGLPPLRYAHAQSSTIESVSSTSNPIQFRMTTPMTQAAAGRNILISELTDPDGIGHVHLRKIATVAGNILITLDQVLPWSPQIGSLVDLISISRVGLRPPVTAPTPTVVAGGFLKGEYSWRVTYVSDEGGHYVESEPGPATTRVNTGTGGSYVTLTNIPMPLDPRVVYQKIYRTMSGGDGIWYLAITLSKNPGPISDNVKDELLGVPLKEFTNNPPYETMEVVAEWPHAQRLMGIARLGQEAWGVVWTDGPDPLRQQPMPESWPLENYLFIGIDSGDRPRGLAAFYDSMLVFCQRSIWRIQGIPPDLVVEPVNFQYQSRSGIGVDSHHAIVTDQNEVIFPGPDGVYMINRYTGVAAGFQSQRISRQIDALWDQTGTTIRNRAHAVFYRARRQYRLFWPLFGSAPDPGAVLVYQFDADMGGDPHYWSLFELFREEPSTVGMAASLVAQPEPGDAFISVNTREAVYLGTDEGAILMMDAAENLDTNGFGDFGWSPYPMEYTTVPFAPGGGISQPALGRFLHLALLNGDAAPQEMLIPRTSLVVGVDTRESPIEEDQVGLFDPGARVSFTLSGTSYLKLLRLVLLARGQYHRIKLIDKADREVQVHRMVYYFQRLPEPGIPETLVQVEPTD